MATSQTRVFLLGACCLMALLTSSPANAARSGSRALLAPAYTKLAIHIKFLFNNQSGIDYITTDLSLKLKATSKASSAVATYPFYTTSLAPGWSSLSVYFTNGTKFAKWTVDKVLPESTYLNNDNLIMAPKFDKQHRNTAMVFSKQGLGFRTNGTSAYSWNIKVISGKFVMTAKGLGASAGTKLLPSTAIYS